MVTYKVLALVVGIIAALLGFGYASLVFLVGMQKDAPSASDTDGIVPAIVVGVIGVALIVIGVAI